MREGSDDIWRRSRLPMIFQTESAECGLACLGMISSFHGAETDLPALRRKFRVSSQGTTLRQLIEIASELSMSTRALRLEMSEVDELHLPCVAHWNMDHFVVIESIAKNFVKVHDPVAGEVKFSKDEFSAHFTGIALELTPTHSFKSYDDRQTLRLRQLWSRSFGLKRSLLSILAITILLQVFVTLSPLHLQLIVDGALLNQDSDLLVVLLIGFLLLVFLECGFSLLRELMILSISSTLNQQITSNLFHHLLRLPLRFFESRHIGDITSRFNSLDEVQRIVTVTSVNALVDGVLTVTLFVAMLLYSAKLTLFVGCIVFLYFAVRIAFYGALKAEAENKIRVTANYDSFFLESVRAIRTIRIFGKEASREGIWKNSLVKRLNSEVRVAKLNIGFSSVSHVLFGVENCITLYLAAQLVLQQEMSVGMLFAYVSLKSRLVASSNSLVQGVLDVRMLHLHLDRISDIAFTDKDPQRKAQVSENTPHGLIEVKGLACSYGGADGKRFEYPDMLVNSGESLVITGPSGCGKTTLIKSLLGVICADKGEINIGGVTLGAPLHCLPGVAAVMQDDQLLSGTILENLTFFDDSPDIKLAQDAAALACVHNDIMAMPMGYNTLVGDMGSSLSGGEKQRLFLARALYQRPTLLVLDESSSHLDAASEKAINANLKRLRITRILVAHRQETIDASDVVVSLHAAKVQRLGQSVATAQLGKD